MVRGMGRREVLIGGLMTTLPAARLAAAATAGRPLVTVHRSPS
jgi:hypothetical protein